MQLSFELENSNSSSEQSGSRAVSSRAARNMHSCTCTCMHINFYSHIHADKKSEAGKLTEEHYLKVTSVKSEILGSKIVRAVGPRYYQTVVDVKITK